MRFFELVTILGLSSACSASVMWSSGTTGAFDSNLYTQNTKLSGYTAYGWSGSSSAGPTIANSKLNLNGSAGSVGHAITDPTKSLQSSGNLCIGFSLDFTQALTTTGSVSILSIKSDDPESNTITVAASNAPNNSGILLTLTGTGTINGSLSTILVEFNTPTRILLTVVKYQTSIKKRFAYLSDAEDLIDLTTDYSNQSSISLNGINPYSFTYIEINSSPYLYATLDDLMIGNNKDEVYAVPHAPEPATAVLSLPLAMMLIMRRKNSAEC